MTPELMQLPYELLLGWRYTRAGRSTRRNGFISFISGVSMLGIALGVAALIIVLSVMNGFQKEVTDRMLSVVSHVEIFTPDGQALPDVARTLAEHYGADCPIAVVSRASWPDQKVLQGTLADIAAKVAEAGISKTAMIVVGRALERSKAVSRLYSGDFAHGYRAAKKE